MTEKLSKFNKKAAWCAIIVFCIRCVCAHNNLITDFSFYDVYGYAGESIAVSTIILVAYEKWLWKINPLEKTPVLKKKYKGNIISNYDGKSRRATLEIKQTLLSVSVVLETEESRSRSISASIDNILDEWQLTYCYMNVPQIRVRDRSEIHYGTAILCVENADELRGEYYTDRSTAGDMKFIPE